MALFTMTRSTNVPISKEQNDKVRVSAKSYKELFGFDQRSNLLFCLYITCRLQQIKWLSDGPIGKFLACRIWYKIYKHVYPLKSSQVLTFRTAKRSIFHKNKSLLIAISFKRKTAFYVFHILRIHFTCQITW